MVRLVNTRPYRQDWRLHDEHRSPPDRQFQARRLVLPNYIDLSLSRLGR